MKLKRLLASMLAFCMILSTMGTVAFAEESVGTPTKGYFLTIYNADGTEGMTIDGTKSASEFCLRSALEDAYVFANNAFLFDLTLPVTYKVEMYEDSFEDQSFEVGSDVTIIGNGHDIVLAEGVEMTGDAVLENVAVVKSAPAVTYVAFIGEQGYETVQAAIDAAKNGETVEICAGEFGAINISNKNITIKGTVGANGELLTTIKGGNPAITGHFFNGTIQDIKIVDAWSVMYAEPAGNVTVDNVYVTGATYGFHLVAYTTGITWTIQNSYMDLRWANSFGVYNGGYADIIVKGNEFVSTDPYYPDYGALHVNSFSPNVTIEENIFRENARIYIDDSVTDTSNINVSKNYHADGVDKAFAVDEDGGKTVDIYQYYTEIDENGNLSGLVDTRNVKIGDTYYTTLAEAINKATAEDTIELIADVAITEPLVIAADKTVKFDLNGFDITYSSTTQGEAMITNKGNLTINDTVGTGVINYNYTGAADSSYGKGNYTISNAGNLTVNGGKITIADLRGHAKYPIDNNSTTGNAVLVINGGHLYNYNTSAIRQFCNSTTYKNSVTINGGVIEGYCAIWVQNPGSNTVNGFLSITDGTVKTTAAAYVNGTSELKDVASKIYFTTKGGAWSEDSAVSITGGIIEENVCLAAQAPADITVDDAATYKGYVELLAPAAVAKIGETEYATLQAAIDAAQNGVTITLIADVTLAEMVTIPADKDLTIDLAGKSISMEESIITTAYALNNLGTLTMKNSGETGSVNARGIYNGYNAEGNHVTAAKLTIVNGAYNAKGTNGGAAVFNYGILDVDGGEFTSAGGYALNNQDGATMTVSDANVRGGIYNLGNLNVDNSEVYQHISGRHAVYNWEATLVIESGQFDSASGNELILADGQDSSVTINGGTFDKTAKSWLFGAATDKNITFVINGGTFNGYVNLPENTVDTIRPYGDPIVVKGGTFNFDPTNWLADGYVAIKELTNGNYVVGETPTATVNNLGAMTIPAGDYMSLGGGSTSEDMELSFVMQFLADQNETDMLTSPYADWYGDFVITFTGIENGSFKADGCYLAGYYGDFGWVKVPVDDMTVEEGVRYPVMLGYGAGQKYDYICESVKDFRCAMYLTPEILAANPNITVNLELSVVDNSAGSDAATEALMEGKEGTFYKTGSTEYVAKDFAAKAVAKIGETEYATLQGAIDAAENGDTITIVADIEMTSPAIISGKAFTLDLGEYTLYDQNTRVLTNSDKTWGLIALKDNANLTVCGNGTIDCNYANVSGGWTGMAYCFDVDKTSELTVNSGTFTNGNGGIQTAGKVTVNNGTFVSHNGGTCIMATGSDAKVTVNDGTFKDSVEESDRYTGSGAVWGGFGATINIHGGTYDFAADPEHNDIVWTLFPAQNAIAGYGDNANMAVSGGTFVNFNPATNAVLDWSASEGFTFGSVVADGYEVKDNGDGTYGVVEKEEDAIKLVAGTTATLDSSLALNFYLNASVLTGTGYEAVIEHTKATGNVVTTVIPEAAWITSGAYKIVCYTGVAAKEMADNIKLTVRDADGNQVKEAFETSLRQYALETMENYKDQPKWLKALTDMLNYGAAAQIIFKYNTDDLASKGAEAYQEYASTEYTLSKEGCDLPSTFVAGTTLTLEDMIKLNVYFNDAKAGMKATYSFTTHGGTYVEKTVEFDSFVHEWGYYGVAVDDIAIADAATLVTVTLYNSDNTVVGTAKYSVNAYLKDMIDDGKEDEIYPALAKFAASAKAAFAK